MSRFRIDLGNGFSLCCTDLVVDLIVLLFDNLKLFLKLS